MNLTLFEASEKIQRGELSPVELTGACIARIEALDTVLNCFITRTFDTALDAARRAEREIARGERRGPLHGLPLALKDLYETAGVRTTAGSRVFAGWVPDRDARLVERLKEAGAVLLGKLNMHEIALGVTTVNPHYGPCRNPWATDHVSGGSSGGSAAALAAGMCLGSLGTDTGGSIRIPASLCGVVGLKPTYGRASLRGVIPLSWNLDHAGPMARRVRDVALLLQVIAGYDPEDPASIDRPVDEYVTGLDGGVQGWRVALASGEFFERCDPQVTAAVGSAARVFSELGARVEEVDFPAARQAAQANGLITPCDAAAFHQQRLQERPADFGADVLKRLQTGAAYSSTEYVLARRTQVTLRRQFEHFFQEYDILLLPTTPVPAPDIEGQDAIEQAARLTRFTAPFNLTGLPALSLPCGFTQEGLPVGLQIVSRPWAEAVVLRAGQVYEQATEWHRREPPLPPAL